MDEWEKQSSKQPENLLTLSTSEELRVTLRSMIDLHNILKNEFKFQYVLTGKINQYPLEVSN